MTREIVFSVVLITACLILVGYGMFSGTPIRKYAPENGDEAAIVALITRFHGAATARDTKTYLACLDGEGQFMFSGTRMVSKPELASLLPEFWAALESGDMTARAMCRESLNGNFFDGSLYDPVISTDGSRAKAVVSFVTPIIRWKTLLFLDLVKQDQGWRIHRLKWDMG